MEGTCLQHSMEDMIASLIFDNKLLRVLQTLLPKEDRKKCGNGKQTSSVQTFQGDLIDFYPQNPVNFKSHLTTVTEGDDVCLPNLIIM